MTVDVYQRYTLPQGWEWKKLGELCIVSDRDHRTPKYVENGIPLISPRDFTDEGIDFSDLKKVDLSEHTAFVKKCKPERGDVLYSRIGTIGEARLLNFGFDFVALHSIALIKPRFKDLHSKYLLYLLKTPGVRGQAKHNIKSVGTPDLGLKRINNFDVPLAPPGEQQRIVAEIEKQFSRLDESVASLKRTKANLKRYKAAVLKAAVEGKLTEEWRRQHPDVEPASKLLERILGERRAMWEKSELKKLSSQGATPRNENWKKRYKEAQPPKPDETYLIPQGWVWTNLGQLSWSVKDGPHYSPKYSEMGVPFISGGNIRPEGIDFATAKCISRQLHEELSERCKPEFGDLLYTKGGTTGIARINTERREFSVWVHVAVLKLVDSVKRFYLQHALNSPHCYRQSQKYTHGVGNQDLGLTRMIWITIPLPPLQEQEQIIDEVERRLSVIDELEADVEANLTRADHLRRSILAKAFKGTLIQ